MPTIYIKHPIKKSFNVHDNLFFHVLFDDFSAKEAHIHYECAHCGTREIISLQIENFDGSLRTDEELNGRIVHATEHEHLQRWTHDTQTKKTWCPKCPSGYIPISEYLLQNCGYRQYHQDSLQAYTNVAVPAKSSSGQSAPPYPHAAQTAAPPAPTFQYKIHTPGVFTLDTTEGGTTEQFNLMQKMLKEVLPFVHDGGTLTNEQKVYVELKLGDIRELKKYLEDES